MKFNTDILVLVCEKEIELICDFIRKNVRDLGRDSAMIGISGRI
jgi:NH3-dependent NAD+ synthetase